MRQGGYYTEKQLQKFWDHASLNVPVVIVGGGRWARVWAEVIVAAQGDSKNVSMVSRQHSFEVQAWARERVECKGIKVYKNLREIDFSAKKNAFAIVSGRPRHHCRDAIDAMKLGLDVLLEKPVAHILEDVKSIVAFSALNHRSLAVVNEFSFLPELNFFSEMISKNKAVIKSITIDWFDVPNEMRHGATKRSHAEVSYLQDIITHFLSILSVFVPISELKVQAMPRSLSVGAISFRDDLFRLFLLRYNNADCKRKRAVIIETDKSKIKIDFSEKQARVSVQGGNMELENKNNFFDSTLRLQLGAFLHNRNYKSIQNFEIVNYHMRVFDRFI